MVHVVQYAQKEALSFSTLSSEASKKANVFTVRQASLSLDQSCYDTTKG